MSRLEHHYLWVPSLYFSKGIPYVVVTIISLLMLRQMGCDVARTTAYVSLCYVPWVVKPWWKPWVERILSARQWILFMQIMMVLSFIALAFSYPSLWKVVAILMLLSWFTAIHNVAVDGMYRYRMQVLPHDAHLVTRELSRKMAFVVGQGILVMLAGNLQVFYRNDRFYSWRVMSYAVAGMLLLLLFWHLCVLPKTPCRHSAVVDAAGQSRDGEPLWFWLALFAYPLAQYMVSKVSVLFLVDSAQYGGLAMSPQEFGLVMGTVGILGLTVGGLLGSRALHWRGLSFWQWPMSVAMLVPALVYVVLSYFQTKPLTLICALVWTEQMAFGFGFSLYLAVLRIISRREAGKSVMALSLLAGCCLSGYIQRQLGYNGFFVLALLLSCLSFLSVCLLRLRFPDRLGTKSPRPCSAECASREARR